MNILVELAWKQDKQRCTYVHLKNFILVAFRVVCTTSGDGLN